MSQVTNIILITSISEDAEVLAESMKNFRIADGRPFNLVSVDDERLPKGWYGGGKMMEANVFIGAYNYLDLARLIHFLKAEVDWEYPESVQILSKAHTEEKFSLTNLFT